MRKLVASTFASIDVASRTLTELQWENAILLEGDVDGAITALKAQPGHDLQIIGSGNLIQSLRVRCIRLCPQLDVPPAQSVVPRLRGAL